MTEEEANISEALKTEKNQPQADEKDDNEEMEEESLALLKNRARNEMSKNKKEITESFSNTVTAPTTKLLRASWEYLIPSFGLTWLYINFHWFMSCTWAEKFFAPLGHEWFLEAEKAGGVIAKQRIKTLRNRANLLEKMGVGFTDITLLAAFIFIIAVLYFMLEYLNFWGFIKLGWEYFKGFFG